MNADRSLASAGTSPILRVTDLRVRLTVDGRQADAVEDVTFELAPGETLGVVGESGSGKSMMALSLLRLQPRAASIEGGQVLLDGTDILGLSDKELRKIRGRRVGFVFQDPLAFLNPLMSVGDQIAEALSIHGTPRSAIPARVVDLLTQVGVRDPERRQHAFPHEFSGGMRQRVIIAIAIANGPEVLIADEPTTALDVTVQQGILRLLKSLARDRGMAMVLITHDIGVVEEVCDQVLVLYSGRVAERGHTRDVLADPQHPYTRELMRSSPRLDVPRSRRLPTIVGQPPDLFARPLGCAFAPRCPHAMDRCRTEQPQLLPRDNDSSVACWASDEAVRGLAVRETSDPNTRPPAQGEPVLLVESVSIGYQATGQWLRRRPTEPVVKEVSLEVRPGEALGLVGESGSGKSTLARSIVGLLEPLSGDIVVTGQRWTDRNRETRSALRRSVQMVFQDPYQSLNPRQSIHDILLEPLAVHRIVEPAQRERRIRELIDLAGLSSSLLERRPYQLSGGQRQRVGIARALSVEPKLIVADEPVSALDVSVQAQIVNLLADLRDELDLSYLVIAHDLGVVRHLCDRIAVMSGGRIVELGDTQAIFDDPQHHYTRSLIAASPGSVWTAPESETSMGPATR